MVLERFELDLNKTSEELLSKSAEERVAWALEIFADKVILSSSFGAQSAVLLHMVTQQKPEIPVILVDTGYLFPETYEFIDHLTTRLKLNLKTYRSKIGTEEQERRFGKLWEKGLEGIKQYNLINKVEPMNRALEELGAQAWIAGLRRQQSSTRQNLSFLKDQGGILKIYPILDWTDKDVYQYLTKNKLPYHPLWEQGFVSIGDIHTTRKLEVGMSEEETRFFGLKRECGLHEG